MARGDSEPGLAGVAGLAGSLAQLGSSLGSRLGLGGADQVGLPVASKYVVLLVDGLGWTATRQPEAATLSKVDRWLLAPIPSTTAAGITSLTTGLEPSDHGLVGYTFAYPSVPNIISPLRLSTPALADEVQSRATIFERLAALGVAVSAVGPQEFRHTGFTQASLRGARFGGVQDEASIPEFVAAVVDEASGPGPSLTYAYLRALDGVGHRLGVASTAWHDTLSWVDDCVAALCAALPSGVVLVVTGDHGMIDVEKVVLIREHPQLAQGVLAFGGEGRFAHLYTDEPPAVQARWQAFFGDSAQILTRDEAVARGWFAAMSSRVATRVGDVVAAMMAPVAVIPQTRLGEAGLIGMHGSLTDDERRVPLFIHSA